jgi:large subunit ribosomal protein L25
MTFTLNVLERTEHGKKLAKLRKEGKIPGVVYGPKQEPISVTLDKKDFEKAFKEVGESNVVTLAGLSHPTDVLVHDVMFNAQFGGIAHVDFYAIEKGKKLTVDVPLVFTGEAPALKLGGTLTKVLHEVEVTADANKLPKEISVDVSLLVDFATQIHVRDLVIPAGVEVKTDADDVVALVQEVKEEVEAPVAVVDMAAVEVEKKGKTEEEAA